MTPSGVIYPSLVRQLLPFHVVGVSHHTASVEERERFAFSPAETASLLEDLKSIGLPGLLLFTCNRCELYWHGAEDGEAWFRALARGRSPAPQLTIEHGPPAVRHLFRVSAGLDSQILGETEILGQVRRAYDAARAAGTTTHEMDLIFSAALAAGRRIRRETLLGRHPQSVSSAAVDVAYEQLGRRLGKVLVLGAGEAAEGVLRALHELGGAEVTLLNRHSEKAVVLARAWCAATALWEELDQHLTAADAVLVATSSSRPVLKASQLAAAAQEREQRKLLVIDLAVPRNVDPAARTIDGVELLDLDDLQHRCCPAAARPSAELAEAEDILEEELVRLGINLRGRLAAPRLAELHALSRQVAEQESAWALAQLDTLSASQREVVRQMADRVVRRVLYPVSRSIREESDPEL
ncbi:MAG TPA: glutamyl-tRNA reductase [Gemmatimonadales bacterium]|nr:glutamyl-tRNA reductase [Gemmatimonadales bacterium]